jgi:hypothetical protein
MRKCWDAMWVELWQNWRNVIVFGLHIGLHIQHCWSMTKSDYCHGCSVICDEIFDEIGTTSQCLDSISGFISSAANLWRNMSICHGCSVICDEIRKHHGNFIMDQRISCSVFFFFSATMLLPLRPCCCRLAEVRPTQGAYAGTSRPFFFSGLFSLSSCAGGLG